MLDLTNAAPLEDEINTSHSSTVAIILSVLFLALVTAILIVVYYRRRMKRLEMDLNNRSVLYVENSILDHGRHHNHALVISDKDPIEVSDYPTDPTMTVMPNNAPNNAAALTSSMAAVRQEKNVNIDRYKLGLEDSQNQESACSDMSGGGACAIPDEEEGGACGGAEELPEPIFNAPNKKNLDINVFEDESPSKERNNFLLDNSRKINKTNVDLVFHRNDLSLPKEEDDNEDEDDEVSIAKMTSYLNEHPK